MTGPESRETVDFVSRESQCFPRRNLQRRLPVNFVGNSAPLPSDAIDFAMLLAQRFWWETVSLLGVM